MLDGLTAGSIDLLIIIVCGLGIGAVVLLIGVGVARARRWAAMRSAQIQYGSSSEIYANASLGLNRRSQPRRRGEQVDVEVFLKADDFEPIPGWIIDRSGGGLRLGILEAVKVGRVIGVRVKQAQDLPLVWVKVRNCHKTDMGWEIGCQFVGTPTWNVMLLFR